MMGFPRATQRCLPVPIGEEFAYIHNGRVTAVVMWPESAALVMAAHRTPPLIYAPSLDVIRHLPRQGVNLGRQIRDYRRARLLVPFRTIAVRTPLLYRVDDRRTDQGHSYMIWAGKSSVGGPLFFADKAYHFLEPKHASRRQTWFGVRQLLSDPDAVHITTLADVNATPAAFNTFEVPGRLTV